MPVKKSVRFALPRSRRTPIPIPGVPCSSSAMTASPQNKLYHPLPYPQLYPQPYPSIPFQKAPSSAYQHISLSLHSYFIPNRTNRPNPQLIQWNTLDHHSLATRGRHHLLHPASHPPLPFMKIIIHMNVSPHHPRPFWVCRVHPSNHQYVTILDVLDSLYNSLRRNISEQEFDMLSDEDKITTSRHYKRRYRRLQDYNSHLAEQERTQGMKRIDFLTGCTRFAGLTEGRQPDEFHLKVT